MASKQSSGQRRTKLIVDTFTEAFEDLMNADSAGFRGRCREMAADPFAFSRCSACLFYADVTAKKQQLSHDHTRGIWIHGDLHAENLAPT